MWQIPRIGESTGTFFDICHSFTQLTILFTYIERYGFFFWGGGGVIKENLIVVILIVTLQNYYGDLGDVCGKYPGWVKVSGPFDICHFVTQFTILVTYIEIYGFWGARYKRGSNFSYLDCHTPRLLWRPR